MSNKQFLIGVGKETIIKNPLPVIIEENDEFITIPLSPKKNNKNNNSELHGCDFELLCIKIKCGTYDKVCIGVFNLLCIGFKCKCNKCCKN
jgi:hypothetical protein